MGQFCCSTCRNTIFLLVILFASCLSQDVRGNEGTCSRPAAVANANLRSKYRNTEEFTEGSEVEYDCNIGYSITGRSRNRKCLKRGNWSPVEFECELIRCTYLPHPDNGRRTDANNGAGETTRFSCNPGYTLKGPSQLICRTDGEWSPRYTPKCEPILCPELLAPRNGDIFQDTSDGVRNNYESIVQYTCNYGYTINGTTSRTINRRCEADGTWDGYNYFCDTLKCEHIEFYGGTLNYFGSTHRAEGTYVYYSCYEGYTMVPSGVDYSECMRTSLRWKPDPPKCYGNCRLQDYQPINKSLVRRQKDGERKNVELADSVDIVHLEKIMYSCKNSRSYELCVKPNDQVLCTEDTLSDNFTTTCTNGTFDKVNKDTRIFCQERRCSITYQANTCFWTNEENCIKQNFKIQSQSSVNVKCNDGIRYELYENLLRRYPDIDRSTMKCDKGNLLTDLSCVPKRCDMSDIPTNRFTIRTPNRRHILHSEQIVYSCIKDQYELYVNSTDSFPGTFNSTCRLGEFDVLKQNFPMCTERRCSITYHANTCFWTNEENCIKQNFKIQSQSSVNVKCNDEIRYELYDNLLRRYPDIDRSTMKCDKGNLSTHLSCVPKRCDMSDISTNRFTIRTPDRRHILHSEQIVYRCIDVQYELYVNSTDSFPGTFNSTCRLGEFDVLKQNFPMCTERRCGITYRTRAFANACFWQDNDYGGQCKPENFKIASRSSVNIRCNDGYALYDTKQAKYLDVERSEIRCERGQFITDLSCKEKQCKVPEVKHASVKPPADQFVNHSKQAKFKCEENYHFEQKFSKVNGTTTVSELVTTCSLGNWSQTIQLQCNPDGCNFTVHEGSHYFITNDNLREANVISHNTDVTTNCSDGYDLFKKDDGSLVNYTHSTVTCRFGSWQNIHLCRKRCKRLEGNTTSYYKHNETSVCKLFGNVTCVNGNWTRVNTRLRPFEECLEIKEQDHSIETATNMTLQNTPTSTEQLPEQDHSIETTTDMTLQNTPTSTEQLPDIKEQDHSIETATDMTLQNTPTSTEQLPGCEIPMDSIYEYTTDKDGEIKQGSFVTYGTVLNVKCRIIDIYNYTYDHQTVQCINGKLGTANINCSNDCEIPINPTYNYTTVEDEEITHGSFVTHGTVLNVKCSILQLENYDDFDDHPTVQCINGRLGTAHIRCLDEWEEKKNYSCKLQNGQLHPFSNIFNVSCDEGYELDLMRPDKPYCECLSTGLVCVYGRQTPQCLPAPCKIPEDHDSRLTIRESGKESFLSRGMSVKNGTSAYFNCINSATEYLEPNDRRFECMKGKWLEEPTEKQWLKVNTSYFPQCREVNCEIPKNYDLRLNIHGKGSTTSLSGGMSVNHGESVFFSCTNSATDYFELNDTRLECMKGKWLKVATHEEWLKSNSSNFPECRKAICDPMCKNGGKCVGRNMCMCQPQSTGSRCEKIECDPECEDNGGKCIAPGKCDKLIKYVIQIKTGTDYLAGTGASVYVYLHGPKYATRKLYIHGTYVRDGLVERTLWAEDVTPIQYIRVGRESVRIRDDLQVDFVSIVVDFDNGRTTTDDQFYHFDAKPDLWIHDSADQAITLSEIKYLIQIKTGSNTYAEPNAKLYVILHGDKYSSQKLYVGKTYYRELDLYEDTIMAVDITPIRSIEVGRDNVQGQADLQVDFVSIFVDFDNSTTTDDQFYNFDAKPDLWIHDSADQPLILSGCIYTFKRHIDKYPRQSLLNSRERSFRLGRGEHISERTCKQLCVRHTSCTGVCYYKRNKETEKNDCWGLSETDDHYFEYSTNSNYFRKYC